MYHAFSVGIITKKHLYVYFVDRGIVAPALHVNPSSTIIPLGLLFVIRNIPTFPTLVIPATVPLAEHRVDL